MAAEQGVADLIHFAGETADVGYHLRNVDIGVLCSDREGLSNAILEYMADRLPVVATDTGGNRELVAPDAGAAGSGGDHVALAEALRRLVLDRDLRARMVAGHRRVRENFLGQGDGPA